MWISKLKNRSLFSLRLITTVSIGLVCLYQAKVALAVQRHMEIDEVAHSADLIFEGTVSQDKHIKEFSSQQEHGEAQIATRIQVQFDDVYVISSNSTSQVKTPSVQIEYAGDFTDTCDNPPLIGGKRYLAFIFADGQAYINPLVGGDQGLYEVLQDELTTQTYILSLGGKILSDIQTDQDGKSKLIFSRQRVKSVSNGIVEFEDIDPDAKAFETTGIITAPSGQVKIVPPRTDPASLTPLNADEFYRYLLDVLNKPKPKLALGLESERKSFKARNSTSEKPTTVTRVSSAKFDPRGQPLYIGRWRTIPFSMYQRHTSELEYNADADMMHLFDKYLAVSGQVVFNRQPFGPSKAGNGKSEFVGFHDDASLAKLGYIEKSWGSSIGYHFPWVSGSDSTKLVESDILFKTGSSTLHWVFNYDDYLNRNGQSLYFQNCCLHELGHAMGLQGGGAREEYNYDQLSIMHRSYGRMTNRACLYPKDCYLLRQKYPNFGVPVDGGIESCYASNGLNLSTTDKSIYNAGDAIRIYNLTFTNCGLTAARMGIKFYLSTSRVGKTYPLSGGAEWVGQIAKESEIVSSMDDGDIVIPAHVPTGDYYIVMTAAVPGDQVPFNDMTSMYYKIRVNAVPRPDLQDAGESFRSFTPGTAGPGGAINVKCRVQNTGNAASGTYRVSFYASADATINASDKPLGNIDMPGLQNGSFVDCNFNGILPVDISPGSYYVGWIIDSTNAVNEANESNNIAYKTGSQLIVTNLSDLAFASADAVMHVKGVKGIVTGQIVVVNRGAISTASTDVAMTIHGPGGEFIDYLRWFRIPALAAGESVVIMPGTQVSTNRKGKSKSKIIKFKFTKDFAYDKILGFFIDPENTVAETNETNNTYASYIVAPPPKNKK